jgi:diguanylate cyclase (GGDEF)-like protein
MLPAPRFTGSLALSTLRSAAVRIALIVLVGTLLAYVYTYRSHRDSQLAELQLLGRERVERELQPFLQAERNLALARQDLLDQMRDLDQEEVDQRYEQIAQPWADGTRRSPQQGFDLGREAQVWVARHRELSPAGRRQLVAAHGILSEMGPAWRADFPDVYFIGAEDFVVNHWYGVPFVFSIDSAFTFLQEPYYTIGLPEQNPERLNRWTRVYLDPTVRRWMVSSISPVYDSNGFLGVVGHDVYLDQLLERTVKDHPPGASQALISLDGYLIAHPDYMDSLLERNGDFAITQHGDERLRDLYARVTDSSEQPALTARCLEDEVHDRYLITTPLAQPGWLLVMEYPKALISERAFAYARNVLLFGLGSLLMELLVLYLVMRSMVARPLQALTEAAQAWECERGSQKLAQHLKRSDEVGALARAFQGMWCLNGDQLAQLRAQVAEREAAQAALHEVQQGLRVRVAAATSELEAANAELARMALFDCLTGLPNRKQFEQRLQDTLRSCRRDGHRAALLFLDLDGFKAVNDGLGHSAGDRLLQEVARRLRTCVRTPDLVARLGGDEFVVILHQLPDTESAGLVAERLVRSCQEEVSLGIHPVLVSASVGLAFFPDDVEHGISEDEAATRLQQYADLAMYAAKEQGKNAWCQFRPELTLEVSQSLLLSHALRDAIREQQFVAWFQPIYDIPTRRPVALEALVRWQHPTRGLLSPAHFVKQAEQARLISDIDFLVIEQTCAFLAAQASNWPESAYVAVNLSSQSFERPGAVERIARLLERYDVPPSWLAVEVTETSFLREGPATDAVNAMHRLGLSILLDDFGTGYSALSYLKRMPLRALKIDRSFVQDLPGERFSVAIVSTVITMASQLGVQVVAEGIETEEQLRYLRLVGCRSGQGFLFSPPIDASRAAALFRGQAAQPLIRIA